MTLAHAAARARVISPTQIIFVYNAVSMKKKADTKTIIRTVEAILKKFEPIFQLDGGGAELVAVEEDEVILRLLGNCVGCGMVPIHFGMGIEEMIRQRLPQIKEIKYTL